MRTTYAVTKSDRGDWVVTVSHSNGGTFTTPTTLGRYTSRKAAVTTARLLAGRSANVVVF